MGGSEYEPDWLAGFLLLEQLLLELTRMNRLAYLEYGENMEELGPRS
jgi:hypothetical protein